MKCYDMEMLITALHGRRFVKFGLVGGLATLAHYTVMFAGLVFWQAPVVWSFVGACTGAIVGYVLNYTYTFESSLPHIQTTWRYALITALSIIANTAIFFVLSQLASLYTLPAQLLSTLIVFAGNYWLHKKVTFYHARTEST